METAARLRGIVVTQPLRESIQRETPGFLHLVVPASNLETAAGVGRLDVLEGYFRDNGAQA